MAIRTATRLRCLSICCLTACLQAQTNDWNSLLKLDHGASISVVTRGRYDCDLLYVTDMDLGCSYRRPGSSRIVTFPRSSVREVRSEDFEHSHWVVGAVVGAGIGLGLGFLARSRSRDPEARVYLPAVITIIGGAAGGGIGSRLHRHGPVLYREQ
jgi:hypothetical protein